MISACIVETRFPQGIVNTIKAHLRYLPTDTELIIFTGMKCFNTYKIEFPQAKVYMLDKDNFTEHDYNLLLTNVWFWEHIKTEHVLIFQHDSMLLRNGIEEFYQYDYVGSPWKFQQSGGNGGLSLRNVSAMVNTLKKNIYNPFVHGNEDVYFSNHLVGKLAPRNVCDTFACESIFKLGTFGYHAISKYLSDEQCDLIKNQYAK